MEVLTLIIGLLLGAILVVIGQLSISTGLLGRRNQQPTKQAQGAKDTIGGHNA